MSSIDPIDLAYTSFPFLSFLFFPHVVMLPRPNSQQILPSSGPEAPCTIFPLVVFRYIYVAFEPQLYLFLIHYCAICLEECPEPSCLEVRLYCLNYIE